MPQDEVLKSLARQYLNEKEYRDFVALLSLRKSSDRNVRAIAESQLIVMADKLIAQLEGMQSTDNRFRPKSVTA